MIAIAIATSISISISSEEIFVPVMCVAPKPDLTAALALVDAQTPSDRCLVQTIVAAPSRRADRAPGREQRP